MPASPTDYFRNCLVLGWIFGSGKHRFARFMTVFLLWIAVLVAICGANGILFSIGTSPNRIVGLFDDPLFISLCFLVPAVTLSILHLVKRLEEMFEAVPKFITGSESAKDIEDIRSFVSIEAPEAKVYYYCWMSTVAAAFVFAQLLDPLVFNFASPSWALSPYRLSIALYAVACLWTGFWVVVVAGNACWIVFSIVFRTFGMIIKHAREESIFISPLISSERDGFARVGDLAVANALFFSCGIFLLIPFVVKFASNELGLAYMGAYLAAMIVVGVIPVHSVSRAVKEAQKKYLHRLGTVFNLYLRKLISDLKRKDRLSATDINRSFATRVERLATIDSAYGRVERMFTWPQPRFLTSSIYTANVVAIGALVSISKQLQDLLKIPEIYGTLLRLVRGIFGY